MSKAGGYTKGEREVFVYRFLYFIFMYYTIKIINDDWYVFSSSNH